MPMSSELRLQKLSSTVTSSVKVQRISDSLSFLPASSAYDDPSSAHLSSGSAHADSSRRPIVLIYGWLGAKSRHIHKFGDFYLGTTGYYWVLLSRYS